jgi:hypothetical protein
MCSALLRVASNVLLAWVPYQVNVSKTSLVFLPFSIDPRLWCGTRRAGSLKAPVNPKLEPLHPVEEEIGSGKFQVT